MDSIFHSGTIHTLAGITASAVAVNGGRIVAVGSDNEIMPLANSKTKLHNLNGKCMVPGFNDSHCHLLLTGITARQLDLRGVTSVEEIVERGRRYIADRNPAPGQWIVGSGFNHNHFTTPRIPTKDDADAISTQHPILLDRVCGHIGTLNSAGLAALSYHEQTSFEGGVLDKDENGKLNGILREVALDTCKMNIPMPEKDEVKEILAEMMHTANSMGVTSVQSDDLWGAKLDTLMAAFDELEAENKCTVRVWEEVQAPRMKQLDDFLQRGLRTGDGTDFFKIGNIKLLVDGSLGARTAYMREPYSDSAGDHGVPVYTDEALEEIVLRAHSQGMQIAFHSIGDGALEQCITAVEKAMEQYPNNLRHRIVHCQFGDEAQYARMKKAGICADIQPPFVSTDYPIVEARVGSQRAKSSYAWKTLLDMGVHIGGGSDSPVETIDPIWGIYTAVTRLDSDGSPKGGWNPEQCLTAEEALNLYTKGSAYMSFEESSKGTIEAGKLADFAVLDKDILTVPASEIKNIKVMMTVVGGTICHSIV